MEDLVSTLVIRPVQDRFWLLDTIDFLWRAPAVFLFVSFMGERGANESGPITMPASSSIQCV